MKYLTAILTTAWCLAAPFTAFGVEATPSTLTFHTHAETAVITLTDAGEALMTEDFKGSRFMAGESNYGRMIAVSAFDGGVRVAPTDQLEVGSYTLVLETRRGSVNVAVKVPLDGEKSILDQRAEALGGARDEAMNDIGLSTKLPRGSMRFTLPQRYLVGQGFQLTAPSQPDIVYRWLVNGVMEAEGGGDVTLTYVFPAEGDYTVRLEQRSVNGDWNLASESTTLVEASRPAKVEAKRGQRMTFKAVDGYGKYTWTLDGTLVGERNSATVAFPHSGSYALICRCENPAAPSVPGMFYNVRYEITVP
ncbi:MAG: hypothetical protein GC168_03925 [Candidatus Hydrogenedens sp.]|nr:hypothetical protein [Candidatus Hydrogenedens sp.]